MIDGALRVGAIITALYIAPKIVRKDYALAHYFSIKFQIERSASIWTVAFLLTLSIALLGNASDLLPRSAYLMLYVVGFVATGIARVVLVHSAKQRAQDGALTARRIMLVGFERELDRFPVGELSRVNGLRIVAANILRGSETLAEDLALAAASARMLRPDDVYILVPWSEKDVIDSCVNAFLRVPASLHLGPEPVLTRFQDAHIDRNGPIASLNLVRRPLSLVEILQKRIFDVVVASTAMALLAPLFVFIAILIKLDSQGPVFFLQRRYGFNQQPFRIFKFRSMTTLDDGREIVQATVGDARITRVGRFIRRANLDELPQIINVLRGEMSLVGPRPHAMAHDQQFERSIALYARRHNVKPGITGWAQVNGLRGEIISPDIMRKRIEHDLYYIDNWSLWLDIWIICATILSPKAYKNAV
jgi:Undecaprenyl-phosphate glucose phosphotransferase